uniref:Uncharacterized protein n=1 Tax=Arundo donax TaxID=35708 RepID=A0A0A9B1N4_ARUDO
MRCRHVYILRCMTMCQPSFWVEYIVNFSINFKHRKVAPI